MIDVFEVARECDRSVQSSRVHPANETGSPARSEGAGSDQRRGHVRRSAPRA